VHGPRREHHLHQFLYYCMCNSHHGHMLLTSRFIATYLP
jgi:hypothetical protein